jgi:hypothetical protein
MNDAKQDQSGVKDDKKDGYLRTPTPLRGALGANGYPGNEVTYGVRKR